MVHSQASSLVVAASERGIDAFGGINVPHHLFPSLGRAGLARTQGGDGLPIQRQLLLRCSVPSCLSGVFGCSVVRNRGDRRNHLGTRAEVLLNQLRQAASANGKAIVQKVSEIASPTRHRPRARSSRASSNSLPSWREMRTASENHGRLVAAKTTAKHATPRKKCILLGPRSRLINIRDLISPYIQ